MSDIARRPRRSTRAVRVLMLICILAPWFGLAFEYQRATRSEAEIVQSTLDRISYVVQEERRVSCEQDEIERKVAVRIMQRFAVPVPEEFLSRECTTIAKDYAERIRASGPLTP